MVGLHFEIIEPHNPKNGGSQSLGFRVFVGGFCFGSGLKSGLLDGLHHVISMGFPGPKDLVRHGYRESRTPFKLALRSPFSVSQIHTSGSWIKPPSSGGCFVHDNWTFWTSDWRHQRTLPFWRLHSNGGAAPDFCGSWAGTDHSRTAPSADADNARYAKRLLLSRSGRRACRLCRNCTLDRNGDTRWETKSNTGGSAYMTASSCTRRVPRRRVVILLPGVEEPCRCPADQAQNVLLERIPRGRVRAMREK